MELGTTKKETGDLLLEQGKLTDKQLELVRRRQQRLNIPQHQAIIELNFTSEEDTYRALAALNHVEFLEVNKLNLNAEVLELVPAKLVFDHHLVPISAEAGVLTLAFSEPPRQVELGNLRLLLNKPIKVVLTTPSGLHATLKSHYGLGAQTVLRLREERDDKDLHQDTVFAVRAGEQGTEMDATIAHFVEQILAEALRLRATDIHIEPYLSTIKLRYRIDGIIQPIPVPSGLRELYPAIVSRLKVMAGLNIAERRLPHDGRISMKTDKEDYDLRISIMPTKHGEAVCLRVLGRHSLFLDLGYLGMEPNQERLFKEITRLPQGLALITGPTGSGKTTTLYAALGHANDEGRKIITIEDPVEYQLEGITQLQAREDINFTFATGLRSVLRHDPDVVLIGEIRDAETAEIVIRAAQTGHLVFSTLHTNDSISAITRLLEMKIEPFFVGSSLVCTIAQRLAQRICRKCRVEDPHISEEICEEMATTLKIPRQEVRAWRGEGCVECNQMGYRGRIAIYEFFLVTEEIADLIADGARTSELRGAARAVGWRSLREQGWIKVQNGDIQITEHQRLTRRINPRSLLAAGN